MVLIPEMKDKVFGQLIPSDRLFLEDSKGGIWVTHRDGIAYLPPKAIKFVFPPKNYFKEGNINNLLEDKEGNIWLSSLRGIYKLSHSKFTRFFEEDGSIFQNQISAICAIAPNRYLMAQSGRLFWIENGIIRPYQFKNQALATNKNEIYHIFKDSQGNIWVAGIIKLLKITPQGEKSIVQNNTVRYIYEDKQKKIWFALPFGGMAFLNDQDELQMLHLPKVNFKSWFISTIRRLRDGRWLVTSYNKGIVFIDKQGNPTYHADKNGLPSINVFNAYEDTNGTLWLVTNAGIVRYKDKKFQHITFKDGLPENALSFCVPT
jgi:ligand-binding sensor domain-containing protein